MRALVFLCLLSVTVAYKLKYDLDNHERKEEGVPGLAVSGKFSFDTKNGDKYKFYYVADKYGYRVVETDVDTDELSDDDVKAFKSAVEVGDGVVVDLQGEGGAETAQESKVEEEDGKDGEDNEEERDDEDSETKSKKQDDDDDDEEAKTKSNKEDDDDDDDEAKIKRKKEDDDDDDDKRK